MGCEVKTITIDGVEYVKKTAMAENPDGLKYVIVRGQASGAFAGYLKSKNGQEVVLLHCRRLWYWDGAASLSQLAVDGTSRPQKCKFPVATPSHTILDAIEIIDCTSAAMASIQSVGVWNG